MTWKHMWWFALYCLGAAVAIGTTTFLVREWSAWSAILTTCAATGVYVAAYVRFVPLPRWRGKS